MCKVYPSNLTTEQYELLGELLPAAKPGGRPREVDMWEVLNAIFYVLVEGVRWRSLPGDFPAWQTVYTYFRNWRKDGTWLRIHERLYETKPITPWDNQDKAFTHIAQGIRNAVAELQQVQGDQNIKY